MRSLLKPAFHVAPPEGWINDPNGPLLDPRTGIYHLFYQYLETGAKWDWGLLWGHAISKDLVTWEHLPPAIFPTPGAFDADGCFSGCATIDEDGVPTILYTGVRLRHNNSCGPLPPPECDLGLAAIETQCLARANPDDCLLETWDKELVPFLSLPPPHMNLSAWRDPFVFTRPSDPQSGGEWTLMIGAGIKDQAGTALVYRSKHLHSGWEYAGELCRGDGATGVIWECPILASLPLLPHHRQDQHRQSQAADTAAAAKMTTNLATSPAPSLSAPHTPVAIHSTASVFAPDGGPSPAPQPVKPGSSAAAASSDAAHHQGRALGDGYPGAVNPDGRILRHSQVDDDSGPVREVPVPAADRAQPQLSLSSHQELQPAVGSSVHNEHQQDSSSSQGSSSSSSSPGPQLQYKLEEYLHFFCVCPNDCTHKPVYYLGQLQGAAYNLSSALGPFILDLGNIFYAPNLLCDPDKERVVMWGWMQEVRPKVGSWDYACCLSMPRALYLDTSDPTRPHLVQQPLPELSRLRRPGASWVYDSKSGGVVAAAQGHEAEGEHAGSDISGGSTAGKQARPGGAHVVSPMRAGVRAGTSPGAGAGTHTSRSGGASPKVVSKQDRGAGMPDADFYGPSLRSHDGHAAAATGDVLMLHHSHFVHCPGGPGSYSLPRTPGPSSCSHLAGSPGPVSYSLPRSPGPSSYSHPHSSPGPVSYSLPRSPDPSSYSHPPRSPGPVSYSLPRSPDPSSYSHPPRSPGPVSYSLPRTPGPTRYTRQPRSPGPSSYSLARSPGMGGLSVGTPAQSGVQANAASPRLGASILLGSASPTSAHKRPGTAGSPLHWDRSSAGSSSSPFASRPASPRFAEGGWRLGPELVLGPQESFTVPQVSGSYLELKVTLAMVDHARQHGASSAGASPTRTPRTSSDGGTGNSSASASPSLLDSQCSGVLLRSWQSGQDGSAVLLYHWDSGVLEVVFEALDPATHTFSLAAPDVRRVGGRLQRPPAAGQPLVLHLFLDYSVLEVFTGAGEVLSTRVYRGSGALGEGAGVEVVSLACTTQVLHLEAHEVGGIWEEQQLVPPSLLAHQQSIRNAAREAVLMADDLDQLHLRPDGGLAAAWEVEELPYAVLSVPAAPTTASSAEAAPAGVQPVPGHPVPSAWQDDMGLGPGTGGAADSWLEEQVSLAAGIAAASSPQQAAIARAAAAAAAATTVAAAVGSAGTAAVSPAGSPGRGWGGWVPLRPDHAASEPPLWMPSSPEAPVVAPVQ